MSTDTSASLSLNTSFLYAKSNENPGSLITLQTAEQTKVPVQTAIDKVNQQLSQHAYGFVEVLAETHYREETRQVFAQLQQGGWTKTLVVVGIGGSDLGGRAIQQALQSDSPPLKVIFHGDSTDPVQITRLLKQINLDETVFNIISKSGQTVETTGQYVFFKNLYKTRGPDWAKHFIFTTDPKEGILRKEAEQFGIITLSIPPNVGGRFSVLTPVGLLPALAMGVDIDQMVAGASEFFQQTTSLALAQQFATSQFQLYQQNTKIAVMMPYSVQLEEFARWFRQLWAESLGKNGKGILPVQARGPADQHSQGQFYNEGTAMQSLLFVRINQRPEDYQFQGVDLADCQYLEGHSFAEIVNIEQEASALALKKVGRPSATLSLSELNTHTLGQLFAFFELAVVYVAEMLSINAFDQPGVEEGKQMMYALLGRSGFEEKKKEIEALKVK